MEQMGSLGFVAVYNLLGGITGWEEAGYPVVKAETAPTTTPPPTTTTTLACLDCGLQVLAVIPPTNIELSDTTLFSIFLVVTNPTDQQISCDIPIEITKMENSELWVTYEVSATLEAGETKLVSYDEAQLPEALYEVQAGGVTELLQVG